jgi:hypothetical protein
MTWGTMCRAGERRGGGMLDGGEWIRREGLVGGGGAAEKDS